MRILVAITALVFALGCAQRTQDLPKPRPSVGKTQIEPLAPTASDFRPGQKRVPLIIPPQILAQDLPRYPGSALEEGVACTARILYHVEVSGRATLIRLEWDVPPPPVHLGAFEKAITDAVAGWAFNAAFRIIPETRDDGSIEPRHQPIPQAQHALVRFRVEDGQAVVE